ncbi:hypothetical protein EIP86_002418 [Pleurotus ostreatoroseus]|nr:hypothetical protein EIP86_002418 [Pleurotus ostreatoroseus]
MSPNSTEKLTEMPAKFCRFYSIIDCIRMDSPTVQSEQARVELFPVLHNLPAWLAPWKRSGDRWFGQTTDFFVSLIDEVKEKIVGYEQGKLDEKRLTKQSRQQRGDGSSHSFAGYLLESKTGLNEQESAWLVGTMFTAGMETVRDLFIFRKV